MAFKKQRMGRKKVCYFTNIVFCATLNLYGKAMMKRVDILYLYRECPFG